MSTIEDFKNASVGATATRHDGMRAMSIGNNCWVYSNGLYLHGEEMGDYTLDPLEHWPTSARDALNLAWELAHPVKEGQTIPKGTRYMQQHSSCGLIGEFLSSVDFKISQKDEPSVRTIDSPLDLKPDWFDAPAVLAVHSSYTKHSVWGKHWDQERLAEYYQSALTAGNAHWSELEYVIPLYPKEEA